MKCIVCKTELENLPSGEINHPRDGVVFTSRGNYGSQVFDPMDATYLEINVCDPCVTAAREDGAVMIGTSRTLLKPWR